LGANGQLCRWSHYLMVLLMTVRNMAANKPRPSRWFG
jgi:hypothetical protein